MSDQTTRMVLRKSVSVRRSPEEAFHLYTDGIDTWWPGRTHSVGQERWGRVVTLSARVRTPHARFPGLRSKRREARGGPGAMSPPDMALADRSAAGRQSGGASGRAPHPARDGGAYDGATKDPKRRRERAYAYRVSADVAGAGSGDASGT